MFDTKYSEAELADQYKLNELIDGYCNQKIGKLKVTCEKSGESLKDNPHIELHDMVCNYLKGVD